MAASRRCQLKREFPIDAPRLQGLYELERMTHALHDVQHIQHIKKPDAEAGERTRDEINQISKLTFVHPCTAFCRNFPSCKLKYTYVTLETPVSKKSPGRSLRAYLSTASESTCKPNQYSKCNLEEPSFSSQYHYCH